MVTAASKSYGIADSSFMKNTTYIPVIGTASRTVVWLYLRKQPDCAAKTQLNNEYLIADVARNLLSAALSIVAIALEIFAYEALAVSLLYYVAASFYCYYAIERTDNPIPSTA
ncbi:MAG: hypothetical protein COT85_00760 [Chlamydiae bacterium CG10_big_fil_rev_8_21_14_0_10_42_34]|nr:MAG: hypothetical protein COT85_00760 [Chlamydiae bacterium CG10_big_fil_rev_8_21_14_0_10_42_34]